MSAPALTALRSYMRISSFPYRHRSRGSLQRWQARQLDHWLKHALPQVPAFRHLAGTSPGLRDLPVMDKAVLMQDFARYNTAGITNDDGWAAFDGTRQIGDLIVGASTGTSGNRGLFVISQAERFAWLGAILAKGLPDVWRHRDRVAVLLPINTPLYDSANRTRVLTLRFFDISRPLDSHLAALADFRPTVLIAPPRILRRLAEADLPIAPRRILSGAETLDKTDRTIIETRFGTSPGEIYMATEGLLAVTCRHNRLHLSEDCLHFELEPAANGLVCPILTDFSRRTQIMARYRLNDLLRLDPAPCPCGSPLQVVAQVVGREDDAFLLPGARGRVELTPDILRNAIVDADRRITDFRLVQTDAQQITLALAAHLPQAATDAARTALRCLLTRHGVSDQTTISTGPITGDTPGKLRRVRRDWTDPQMGGTP